MDCFNVMVRCCSGMECDRGTVVALFVHPLTCGDSQPRSMYPTSTIAPFIFTTIVAFRDRPTISLSHGIAHMGFF